LKIKGRIAPAFSDEVYPRSPARSEVQRLSGVKHCSGAAAGKTSLPTLNEQQYHFIRKNILCKR